MARKGKPMSGALKAYLKKHGHFPKKGALKRSRGRKKARRTHTKARRHTSMARRRYSRRRGRHHFKIPVITVAILAGQGAAAVAESGGNLLEGLNSFQSFYTGLRFFTGSVHPEPSRLLVGWAPWLVKGFVSKVARPMGAVPRIPFGLPFSIS